MKSCQISSSFFSTSVLLFRQRSCTDVPLGCGFPTIQFIGFLKTKKLRRLVKSVQVIKNRTLIQVIFLVIM